MNPEKPSYSGLSLTSWLFVGIFAVLAVVPFLGFLGWILVWPVMLVVVILAIMILTRGGTAQGIVLILISIFVLPFWAFFAPVISSVIASPAIEEHEDPGIDNLLEGVEVPEVLPDPE